MAQSYSMGELIPYIQQVAQAQGVDPQLAVAHFVAENTSDGVMVPDKKVSLDTQGIDPATGKPSGAKGLFQVVGSTLEGLRKNGMIPPGLDYSTLEGQVIAGVAAVKDSQQVANNPNDPLAGAAQYVNGNAGLSAYNGQGEMPAQVPGYLQKIARNIGISYHSKVIPATQQAAVDTSLGEYRAALEKNLPQLQALMQSMTGDTEAAKQAALDTASAQAGIVDATAAGEAQKVGRDNNLLQIFGLQNDQMQTSMDQYAGLEAQRAQMKPVVDHLMAISPFTDPVRWMVAQMQLTSMVPQYNSIVQNQGQLTSSMAERQALDDKQRTITPAVTLATIEDERQARVALSAATANAAVAKLNQEDAAGRAKMLSEQIAWAGQGASLSMQDARLRMENYGIKLDQAAKASDQANLDNINLARIAWGGAPVPTMAQFNALPKEIKEKSIDMSGGVATPGRAAAFVNEMGTLPALQRNAKTQPMADQLLAFAHTADKKGYLDPSAPANHGANSDKLLERGVDKVVQDYRKEITDAGGDMMKVQPDNPYKMVPTQYAQAPALQGSNSFSKFVLDGPGKDMPNLSEKDIIAYAIGQVKNANGTNLDSVSKELKQFFEEGYKYQFQSRGLGTMGMDPRPYDGKVQYQVKNVFSWYERPSLMQQIPDKPVNMMNYADVQRLLLLGTVNSISRNNAIPPTGALPADNFMERFNGQR